MSKKTSKVTDTLSVVLGSSYVLLAKTHGFHWNVTGPMFHALHTMFEEQYTDLFTAVDELAERMRALEAFAPGSFADFAAKSLIKDSKGVPTANEMIAQLCKDHQTLAKAFEEGVPVAQAADDEVTADLFIGRATIHEKTAWMLRSMMA